MVCLYNYTHVLGTHIYSNKRCTEDLGVPLQTVSYLSLAVYVMRRPLSRIMHPQRRDTVSIFIFLLGGSEITILKR